MKVLRWTVLGLVLILSKGRFAYADTGINGMATTSSSFTLTGPVFLSSLTVSNNLAVSTITAVSSATIANLAVSSLTVNSLTITGQQSGITLGKVKQVVSNTVAIQTSTTSTSYVDTALSATITPQVAGDTICILATGMLSNDTSGENTFATLSRGSTNLLASDGGVYVMNFSSYIRSGATLSYCDSLNTVSPTTYKVQIKVNGGTGIWAEGGASSTMILMEIGT